MPTVTYVAKNLQSSVKDAETVSQLLEKEVVGPFKSTPFSVFRTSPIGIVTGKYSGKKRLIFDLSTPRSGSLASVNCLVPPELFGFHYASVDNAINPSMHKWVKNDPVRLFS